MSDTHGYLDQRILHYAQEADEVWHAGDIGTTEVADELKKLGTLRAVYGNIDGAELRAEYPLNQVFEVEGVRVFIKHIGGYPPKYKPGVVKEIEMHNPKIFISGHSHILKVMPDKKHQLIHMNPGAAGIYGFHQVRTMLRFTLEKGKIENLEVIELGAR